MFLLGITGLKQSGKDTVLKCIRELLPGKLIVQRNFADALKLEVAIACGVDVDFINEHKSHFRLIMQGYGSDFRRQLCGDDYWINKWMIAVQQTVANPYLLVCTDVRFLNEAAKVRELGGILWRVMRTQDAYDDIHISETEQCNIAVDSTIYNVSTLDNLKQNTKTLLIKHGLLTTK